MLHMRPPRIGGRMPSDPIVTLDLHGKTVYQAQIAIDAALRRAKGLYRIRLVHGSHRGTALKDMIATEYATHPQVLRLIQQEGATELVLRELV